MSVLGRAYPARIQQSRGFTTAATDTTAPVVTLTAPTRLRISRQPGHDSTDFNITTDEAFVEYQLRVVPSGDSPRTAGTLLESGSVAATQSLGVTVTDDELIAAGGLEGNNIIKAFVRDEAGNWSA